MAKELEPVFNRLRDLLKAHSSGFTASDDTSRRYGLEAPVGPATLAAWGGEAKSRTLPVAWVQLGKTYVSYHLMGVAGNEKIRFKHVIGHRRRACWRAPAPYGRPSAR